MNDFFRVHAFVIALRLKRDSMSLRAAVSDMEKLGEISVATLSRVENYNLPDLYTYALLCQWLDVPLSTFIEDAKPETPETPTPLLNQFAELLHADGRLQAQTISAFQHLLSLALKEAGQAE